MESETAVQALMTWVASHARGQNREQIQAQDFLMKDGYIDSLGMMSLIAYVESLLGTEIPDDLMSFDNFESVQKIEAVFFRGSAT